MAVREYVNVCVWTDFGDSSSQLWWNFFMPLLGHGISKWWKLEIEEKTTENCVEV